MYQRGTIYIGVSLLMIGGNVSLRKSLSKFCRRLLHSQM